MTSGAAVGGGGGGDYSPHQKKTDRPATDRDDEDVSAVKAALRRTRRRLRSSVTAYDAFLVAMALVSVYAIRAERGYGARPAWITDDLLDGPDSDATKHEHRNKPRPIVEDIDGDGLTEIIFISNTLYVEVATFRTSSHQLDIVHSARLPHYDGRHDRVLPVSLSTGHVHDTAANTSYTIIIVVMDNWRVHCFDARLKPLWSVRPIQLHDDFSRRYRPLAFSASVVSRHRRDRSRCQQAVVVSSKYTPILKENKDVNREHHLFTKMWAVSLDALNGTLLWRHKPPYDKYVKRKRGFVEISPITNYLKFVDEIKELFPHHWSNMYSTRIQSLRLVLPPAHLQQSHVKPCLRRAYKNFTGGHNSIAIYTNTGIEILHLANGTSFTTIPMHTEDGGSAYADLDCDNVPDRVYIDYEHRKGVAITGRRDKTLFRVMIDETATWKGFFQDIFTADNLGVEDEEIPVCHPFLLKKKHNALTWIKKILPHNDLLLGYDCFFLNDKGYITSYNTNGHLNWQTSSNVGWRHVLKNLKQSANKDERIQYFETFKPSLSSYRLNDHSQEDIMSTGWDIFSIHSVVTGVVLVWHGLPCRPSDVPVIGDFTNDGINDILFICTHGYIGYEMSTHYNILYTACIGLLIGGAIYIHIWLMTPTEVIDSVPSSRRAKRTVRYKHKTDRMSKYHD